MSTTVWKVFILYEDWYAVNWAPTFDTKEEAKAWIAEDQHEWDGRVEAFDIEIEDEE